MSANAIKSEIFQVTRRSSEDRYLHLIAFITHQYFRLQDNLLDVLLNVLQTYLNTAQREHKEVCYRRREYWNEAVRKLIGYVDHSFVQILSAIKRITDSTGSSGIKLWDVMDHYNQADGLQNP